MYFPAPSSLCFGYYSAYREIMKPIDSLTDDEFTELVQRAARLPDAPPAMLQAAIGLWPGAQSTTSGGLAEAVGNIIHAVLSFDSWARPAGAFAMRSVGSDTRQLLFSASGRDVDLRIAQEADTFTLTGQILGPDETGTIELVAYVQTPGSESEPGDSQPDDRGTFADSRVTPLDELGEFRMDDISAGTYRMRLQVGSDEIVLPPIVVGEQPA